MSFRDLQIKNEYRSLIDNIVQDFYIPLLHDAVSYRRAVGFFSSSSLVEISKGITHLADNGGKIQIVASPYLSEEDIEAIRKGYKNREEIIENAVLSQLSSGPFDYYSSERLNLLANLIASGVMDIRIAYTEDSNGIGMYHEKMGIIEDSIGNKVAFSGSMNESSTAMSINYETIDVFLNWKDENDKERVMQKEKAFSSIWSDSEPNIRVLEFPGIADEMIKRYKKGTPNLHVDDLQFPPRKSETKVQAHMVGARMPEGFSLHDYQEEAITSWVGENYRGIFDMATGTGKTYTGLGAISKLSQDCNDELAVIIVCPYQHLVEQWVDDIVKFNMMPIIGFSSSPQKDWKKKLSDAIRNQKIRQDKKFFCFICTNATFTNQFVQDQLSKIKTPILLVVDEAHNFGASSIKNLLDDRFTYRLALSATLERHRDPEGTMALFDFFGRKCIEYPLERAIKEDKLTPYKYHPIVVNLTKDELATYEDLSYQMSKCLIKDKYGNVKLNKRGEILALQRARLIAGASQKLAKLKEVIEPYKKDHNLLVYCGATNVLPPDADESKSDESDIRMITAVERILGNELGMEVAKFTSEEDIITRSSIKEKFEEKKLQAIVAIKCLDEGVNIPGIRVAFILASTTNPKEYIQRRGRILRKAKGKEFAVLYDFVTLPRPLDEVSSLTEEQAQRDLSLIRNELRRVQEFGRAGVALNPMEAYKLIWEVKDVYKIDDIDEENH